MSKVEYSFAYHGNGLWRLGQHGIHLAEEGKQPYVIARRFGHEEEWRNQHERDSILSGALKREIQGLLESHFDMPQAEAAWFSQQINDDFVKYLESNRIKLSKATTEESSEVQATVKESLTVESDEKTLLERVQQLEWLLMVKDAQLRRAMELLNAASEEWKDWYQAKYKLEDEINNAAKI